MEQAPINDNLFEGFKIKSSSWIQWLSKLVKSINASGGGNGSVPSGTGFRHVTSGNEDANAKLVSNSDVMANAGITENKLLLNFSTHNNINDPTSNEKQALTGTNGTPSNINKYVTDNDSRNTNNRIPTIHQLDSNIYHSVSGLTTGNFLKASSSSSFSFAPHGLVLNSSDFINQGNSNEVLHGNANGNLYFGKVIENDMFLNDNGINDVNTERHGFCPKLTGTHGKFFRDDGSFVSSLYRTTLTGNHTVVSSDNWLRIEASNKTVTLPLSSVFGNKMLFVEVSFGTNGTQIIEGANTFNLFSGKKYIFNSDGSVWTYSDFLFSHGIEHRYLGIDPINLVLNSSDFANQGTENTVLHGNANGDPSFGAIVEADITLANNTTNNVSTSKHGFINILPNDSNKLFNGVGSWITPAGYRYARTIILTGSGTYTPTSGTDAIRAKLQGDGGGGSGADRSATTSSFGGGGGEGGYLEKWLTSLAANYAYVCGAGGAGGSGANDGSYGSDTTFGTGAGLLTAGGGGAGQFMVASATVGNGGTRDGRATSGGDINVIGSTGNYGTQVSLNNGCQGSGGSSRLGNGGRGRVGTGLDGLAAGGYGAGGAGASAVTGGTSKTGGAGSPGIIFVDEFEII